MRIALKLFLLVFFLPTFHQRAFPAKEDPSKDDRCKKIVTHIRWMIRRDMPEVLSTENNAFEFPWSEEDFLRSLRQRNCIGMVADVGDEVAGFMIYELHKTRLHLLNFAVDPRFQRQGVATAMINKLKGKLSEQRRSRLLLEVRERNLPAQLFFREMGFKHVSTLKNFYADTDEDAYVMQYKYPTAEIKKPVTGSLPKMSQAELDKLAFKLFNGDAKDKPE